MAAAAAAAPDGAHSCLLYLVDVASSKQYLGDSSSAFSILSHKSSAEPTGPRLMTADGKPLHCWGHCKCSVRTRTREFSWTFLLAPLVFPILGADFLSNFRLLVNNSNMRLVACDGKLIQLEQGKRTKVAVVTGGSLYSFTFHNGGTLQRLIRAASGQPACKGSQEAQGGGSGPAAGGDPSLLLHFPQWRHSAAAHQGHQQPDST